MENRPGFGEASINVMISRRRFLKTLGGIAGGVAAAGLEIGETPSLILPPAVSAKEQIVPNRAISPRILSRRELIARGRVATPAAKLVARQETAVGKTVFAFVRGPMVREFVDLDAFDQILPQLTDVGYFGIPLNAEGRLVQDSGYHLLGDKKVAEILRRTQEAGVRKILTITQFAPETIRAFFDGSEQNRINSVKEIVNVVDQFGFSGVSIDSEAMGDYNPLRRHRFVQWIERLNQRLKEGNENSVLSVCVHPGTAGQSMLWNLDALEDKADQIFNMAYEYYGPKSASINPTAPLYGADEGRYWSDVDRSVTQFLELMSAKKLILGLPLYGNRAITVAPHMQAAVVGDSGRYATFANAQEFRVQNQKNPGYLEDVSPLAQTEFQALRLRDGTWDMIVVGGSIFLDSRLAYVRQRNLGGIGFWALDHMTYGPQDTRFVEVLKDNLN